MKFKDDIFIMIITRGSFTYIHVPIDSCHNQRPPSVAVSSITVASPATEHCGKEIQALPQFFQVCLSYFSDSDTLLLTFNDICL